jgi:hypothetical protein
MNRVAKAWCVPLWDRGLGKAGSSPSAYGRSKATPDPLGTFKDSERSDHWADVDAGFRGLLLPV